MSLRSDNRYHCDTCGADVGNGSVYLAAVVVDMDPLCPYQTRQLHFGRACGHAEALLTPDALADYYAYNGITP